MQAPSVLPCGAARSVRSIEEPHLAPWLNGWAACGAVAALFPTVVRRIDSISKRGMRALYGLKSAADLLPAHDVSPSEFRHAPDAVG